MTGFMIAASADMGIFLTLFRFERSTMERPLPSHTVMNLSDSIEHVCAGFASPSAQAVETRPCARALRWQVTHPELDAVAADAKRGQLRGTEKGI